MPKPGPNRPLAESLAKDEMLAGVIKWCVEKRWLALCACLVISALGVRAWRMLPIDAYPDISAQQVLIISPYAGRAPEEIERQVTIPIELAMGSVPNVSVIRSRTIFGLSVVELIFDEGVDKYFARQRVQERLSSVNLPAEVSPELGPLATAYGEIFRYELQSDGTRDLMDLRTFNDWVVVTRLQRVPGIAEVVNFGGYEKQYTLKLNPRRLERFGFTLNDVVSAVRTNNANAGGSVLKRGDMSFVIRGRGLLENVQDIESTVVDTVGGTPVYVRDIAEVTLDSRIPSGIFGKDNTPESVEGIVLMRRGENPSIVLKSVKQEVEDLNENVLPDGVQVVPFYDREYLVTSTLDTVTHSVLSGIALVLLVLLAFLGSPSLALLVVLTIPFALLFALVLMQFVDIPIGLLSIGAIDFGILVDGAVIMADQIAHRLTESPIEPTPRHLRSVHLKEAVIIAAGQVQRPIFWSMLMIMCAYLPLLTLTNIEGLLFRPLALTVIFALSGAVLFSLLLLPGLATIFLRRGYRDWENPLLTWFRPVYAGLLAAFLRLRWLVALAVAMAVGAVAWLVVPRLGFDFLPYLDEGVIWVRASFPEGTSLDQTAEFGNRLRAIARDFPDVTFATSQAGRNDSGTDPFAPNRLEVMVGLRPYEEWTMPSKAHLVAELGSRLRAEYPTTRFNFTQPIIDSVTEDTNGTSANLAVEFSGTDLGVLIDLGRQMIDVLKDVPGAIDVNIEQDGPQPQLVIEPDRVRCAQYDVRIEDVNQLINTALGGEPIATLYDRDRRFDIVARFDRSYLTSPAAIGNLPVFTTAGVPIPLVQVADFSLQDGQTIIARDSGRRRITVRCDIVGRDQSGFVAEAQERFATAIQVPEGYRVRWIGMFENLVRASRHFLVVIPVTIAVIYVLLVLTFGTQREALLVLLSVPFAFIGGALALYVRGMTLNVSSGVGFAALFGVSAMNGVLMVEHITHVRRHGFALNEAIIQGALGRMRPVLMASLVAILGLLPASIARGLGSDVQRPLATVIVWGLVSSMLLTLFVIPVLYRLFAAKDPPAEMPNVEGRMTSQ
ncbi:MAG: efflux RND transporter permease subunit [Planctomycetaceae bacterium]